MSYEIVKSIVISKDKVFLTGADSSLRPLHFYRWECEPLTKIFREQGKETLYAQDLKAICLALNISPETFIDYQEGQSDD